MPENFKTAEICLEAVKRDFKAFEYVPVNLKTEEMRSIVSTDADLEAALFEDLDKAIGSFIDEELKDGLEGNGERN